MLLDKGDLSIAMRASISAPGVFAPVDYEGRLLVDGGLVENLPIDVAREMKADILIVSDVSFPLRPREQLDSACRSRIRRWRSWCARMRTAKRRRSVRRTFSSSPPRRWPQPPISPLRVTIRRRGGGARRTRLAALTSATGHIEAYLARRATREPGLPVIKFVRVDPESRRYERTIVAEMQPLVGKPLDLDAVGARITELYGLGISRGWTTRSSSRRGPGQGIRPRGAGAAQILGSELRALRA